MEKVWGWLFENLEEDEVRVCNGNGHTIMHKRAQRRAGEAASVVGRWWRGGWGRDNDGLLPSDLAKAEGWKEGWVLAGTPAASGLTISAAARETACFGLGPGFGFGFGN